MAGIKLASPLSLSLEGGDGQQSLISQNVVVLAENFRLSRPQYDLLSKGLTFIPTAQRNREHQLQMQVDLQTHHRRIKLVDFFKNSPSIEKRHFMGTSLWSPSLAEVAPEIGILIEEDVKLLKKH